MKDNADDIVRDVVKRKKTGYPTDPENMNVEPGDNARYVRLAMASWDLPPIDISDPQQVQERVFQYFQHCAENDRKPQLTGMANWLGIDRSTLNSWKRGEYRTETHSPIIQRAVNALEEMWADYMMNGKVNPASGIFISKNWFNYKDVQDVIVTPNNPLDNMAPDAVSDRYLQALPDSSEPGE